MVQTFQAKPPPLVTGEDGAIRVAGTRVQLETVVLAFDAGATAEEIAQQYPSLELGDVYAVISYLLGNESSVREYVAKRLESATALREMLERDRPQDDTRQRLLARRQRVSGA